MVCGWARWTRTRARGTRVDEVLLTMNVLFIGDYFSLLHTVVLEEAHRLPDESDEDYAVRQASDFMLNYYGWDVAAASNEVGVMDS